KLRPGWALPPGPAPSWYGVCLTRDEPHCGGSRHGADKRMKGLIFTYILTYGGAIIAPFRPFAGLLIYICFATIKPEALWYWSVPKGNYSRIIAIALLLGWAAHGFGRFQL